MKSLTLPSLDKGFFIKAFHFLAGYKSAEFREYAKELISYGQMSLSEISWTLGYSSPAHFSGQFKKETGLSPKQFMAMHRKNRNSIDAI